MRRVRLTLVLALVLFSSSFVFAPAWANPVQASTFAKTYGTQNLNLISSSIEQTADGGYVLFGFNLTGTGLSSPSLIRLDNAGGILWQKTYQCTSCFPSFFNIPRVHEALDGGFILSGLFHLPMSTVNAWVLKVDNTGNIAWQRTFAGMGNVSAVSADSSLDGGAFVAATTYASLCCPIRALVIKLDSLGGVVWQKLYPGLGSTISEANSVSRTLDGGVIVAGDTSGINFSGGWLLKLDTNGGIVWQKAYAGSFLFNAVEQEPDGGFVALSAQPDTSPTASGALVLRLNQTGGILWQKSYGVGASSTGLSSIRATTGGGFLAVGNRVSGTNNFTNFVLQADSLGSITLLKTANTGAPSSLNSAEQTTDSGFVASGASLVSLTPLSVQSLVLKLDVNGETASCPLTKTLPTSTLPVADASVNATIVSSSGTDFTQALKVASLFSPFDINGVSSVVTCIALNQISVRAFFTDPDLNPLLTNNRGDPSVTVVLARGTVASTNPGRVLAWVNVTNTSGSSLQSLTIDSNLPSDWSVSPAWDPPRGSVGAIHVYYSNMTSLGTAIDVTQASAITVETFENIVHLRIANLANTIIGHPLMPGQSILLSIKLSYNLVKTTQSANTYPRNYTDAVTVQAFTSPFFAGTSFSGTTTAFFVAEARVVG